MEFTLNIDCDNAAFSGDPLGEVQRLLHVAAMKIEGGYREGKLVDVNGNTVGEFELKGEPEDEEEDDDGPFTSWEGEEAFNADQDAAEDICANVEPLYILARTEGAEEAFEAAVRAYCDEQRIKPFDPDNVDYTALAAFIRE
jgi:hypothetical protein